MALYREFVLPHLINLAMRDAVATECRSRIVPRATGRVLDVGIGSGLNLPFYGDEVTDVWGIDPSVKLLQMARRSAAGSRYAVRLIRASAEDIPLRSQIVDTVVLTWTLCSIDRPLQALQEMRRVMKPDGRVLFAEHGLAADDRIGRWQHRLNPPWRVIAGGCNLNRKPSDLLRTAGFRVLELETGYVKGPRILSFMYQGLAAMNR